MDNFPCTPLAPQPAWQAGPPDDPMPTSQPQEPPAPEPPEPVAILVLNHHRDELADCIEALRRHGYAVTETQSIIETHRVLAGTRPALIVLNPLVLQPGSVELEILEELQREGDPVPVIMLLEDFGNVQSATASRLPIPPDFITKPFATEELLHRVELRLLSRATYLALQRRAKELEGQVLEDFKTGLINDRHFKSIQSVEFKRAQRHHTPLSLLLIDIDEFKSVNDSTAYTFGDEVLLHVANAIKRTIRATDYAARIGGDEFSVLLPHTSPDEAVRTAERVREAISGVRVESGDFAWQVTVSIGIGTFDGKSRFSAEELQAHANKGLHLAKHEGKNRVALYSGQDGDAARTP